MLCAGSAFSNKNWKSQLTFCRGEAVVTWRGKVRKKVRLHNARIHSSSFTSTASQVVPISNTSKSSRVILNLFCLIYPLTQLKKLILPPAMFSMWRHDFAAESSGQVFLEKRCKLTLRYSTWIFVLTGTNFRVTFVWNVSVSEMKLYKMFLQASVNTFEK